MEKGARNIVLISRRATLHPAAHEFRAKGEQLGCNVQIRDCDIVHETSLINCISDCLRTMPPIRGLVNGAMVLDVRLLTFLHR